MERDSMFPLLFVALACVVGTDALGADHGAVYVGRHAAVAAGPNGGVAVGPRGVVRAWGGGQIATVGPNGYAYRSRAGGFGYSSWRQGSAAWVRVPGAFYGTVRTPRGTRQVSVVR